MVSIGERVKVLREKKGMTQRNLAEDAGVTPATISRLESGKITDLKASALIGVADALGVSIDYLVGRVRELTPGDVINFDPAIQAIVQGYLSLGPEARRQLGEYTVYLEFKRNETPTDKKHENERRHMPDAIISLKDIVPESKQED